MTIRQGDLHWAAGLDKRRPVLVVTRSSAIPVLNRLLVAPITKTIRHIPQEIPIPSSAGLEVDCVASLDNLTTVPKEMLGPKIGEIPNANFRICQALEGLADC